MKHLLLFTIGPVQSFISQARKTHDLYAGSKLLSDLIKTAIEQVREDNLIFPKKGESMPNRFLAFVPEEITDFKTFGEKIEISVKEKWTKIANDIFENTPFQEKPLGFDEQIQKFLEVFWVIKPLDKDYSQAYSEIEKELAAIKNTRPFSQFTWQNDTVGEIGRKCNLDGQQNVQFFRIEKGKNVSITRSPLYSVEDGVIVSDNFKSYELEVGEGLNAVSFVKRKYEYEKIDSFKSTAEIALLDAINDLNRKENIVGYGLIRNYQNLFSHPFNSQLYYEDSLNEDFLRKQGISTKGKSIESLIEELHKLKKCTDFNFNKYYAVLLYDGDDMGKWWSGANLSDSNRLLEFQQKLSSLLSQFSVKAKNILAKNGGQAVYAGGDDFMGFVNLNHLWENLKQLRTTFKMEVSNQIKEFTDKELSFSVGICVAQYKEPLTLVLEEARRAESRAKDFDNGKKDAFSISVIKSSGESHKASLSFGKQFENIERIDDIINVLANNVYSNSFIYNIEREFSRLVNLDKPIFDVELMFREELKRLLKHSKIPGKSAPNHQEEDMVKKIMDLLGSGSLRNFFHLLSIIDFFKRTIDRPVQNLTLEA